MPVHCSFAEAILGLCKRYAVRGEEVSVLEISIFIIAAKCQKKMIGSALTLPMKKEVRMPLVRNISPRKSIVRPKRRENSLNAKNSSGDALFFADSLTIHSNGTSTSIFTVAAITAR